MGAFSEGFLAGLANPKASKGVFEAGSAFYDWIQGLPQKKSTDEKFNEYMRDFGRSDKQEKSKDPFGYFDNGQPDGTGNPDTQGTDRAQIESEKMLRHLEQGIQKFLDSGNPRHNPQQYFNQQVVPRGRHVDPTYDRHR